MASKDAKMTSGFKFKTHVVRPLSPEEREEWKRNSPSLGDESDRNEPPAATD